MTKMMVAMRHKPCMTQQQYFACLRDVDGESSRAEARIARQFDEI